MLKILKKEWLNPCWEENKNIDEKVDLKNKTKIRAILYLTVLDNNIKRRIKQILTVNKFDKWNRLNADWQEILDQYTLYQIAENTKKDLEKIKRKNKIAQEKRNSIIENEKLTSLFEKKLALFEIPEIKNSKNKKLKSDIRKAKNEIDLIIAGTKLVNKEYNE